jgi:hypothetical protein
MPWEPRVNQSRTLIARFAKAKQFSRTKASMTIMAIE